MSQRIDFEGTTHEFPDDFSQADIAKALGGASAPPAAPTDTRSPVTRAYQDYLAKPVTSAVAKGLEIAGDTGLSPYSLKEPSEAVAEAVVPQTPLQAGAMAATGGAGKLVGLAGKIGLPVAALAKYPWLSRILAGAVGGEAAGDISGEPTGKGALVGGGGAAVAEGLGALGPLAGLLRRSTAAGKSAIAADDAARVGTTMGDVAPTLYPGTTAGAMQRTAEGQGLERIGAGKEEVISEIERIIGGRPISVPTVSDAPLSLRAANGKLSEIGDMMRGIRPIDPRYGDADLKQLYGRVAEEIKRGIAGAEFGYNRGLAGARADWTAQTQRKALPPAGGSTVQPSSATGFEARPLTEREGVERTLEASTAPAEPYREMAGNMVTPQRFAPSGRMAIEPVPQHLEPRVPIEPNATINQGERSAGSDLWSRAQDEYDAGRFLTGKRVLGRSGLFKQGEFNITELQKWLRDPANRAALARKTGGNLATGENLDAYNRLVDSITRGAGAGMVDQMSNKPLGLMDTSGSGGAVARGFRLAAKAFPNASTNYVGQLPARYSTTPLRGDVQTLLDLMGEQAAGGASRYVGAERAQ